MLNTTSASSEPLLALNGISKSFPGVNALSDISLELYAGKVTALVGENGAGKSTVVKVLTGIYQADQGDIVIQGRRNALATPQAAEQVGITAIHQETVLFDELSVAENIFLGHAPKNRIGLIDTRAMRTKAASILADIGAVIKPETKLSDLGTANKHLIAIARALSIDARVVIMDEPTAALSYKEIEELYELVAKLKEQGKAILFISHKFDEIFRIADFYTVFRDGHVVGKGRIDQTSEPELVKLMVGRDVHQIFPKRKSDIGEAVLAVKNYQHPTEFADISFTLHKGEILGFFTGWSVLVARSLCARYSASHNPAAALCWSMVRPSTSHPLPRRLTTASFTYQRIAAGREQSFNYPYSRMSPCLRYNDCQTVDS